MASATTEAAALCGRAVDVGVITLDDVLELVHGCEDAAQLDGRLLALAADVALATGTMGGAA
jgi:hypothetical protein